MLNSICICANALYICIYTVCVYIYSEYLCICTYINIHSHTYISVHIYVIYWFHLFFLISFVFLVILSPPVVSLYCYLIRCLEKTHSIKESIKHFEYITFNVYFPFIGGKCLAFGPELEISVLKDFLRNFKL